MKKDPEEERRKFLKKAWKAPTLIFLSELSTIKTFGFGWGHPPSGGPHNPFKQLQTK